MIARRLNRPYTLNNELDQFFQNFFQSPSHTINGETKKMKGLVPAVNVAENENSFVVEVAAPGMKKDDFIVEILDGVLMVSAENKNESSEEQANYTRREFNYSSFERKFTLPENINEDAVKASYENGILSIELPKAAAETKEKKKLISIS